MKQAGEREVLEARHRAHYLALAEDARARDGDSPRIAVGWLAKRMNCAGRFAPRSRSEPESPLRIAAALWRFWHDRGDRMEGAIWLRAALAAVPAAVGRARRGTPRALGARAAHRCRRRGAAHRSRGDRVLPRVGRPGARWPRNSITSARWPGCSRTTTALSGGAARARRWPRSRRRRPTVASVTHTLGVIAATRNAMPAGRELIARGIELLRELPPDGEPLLLPVAYGYGRVPARPGSPRASVPGADVRHGSPGSARRGGGLLRCVTSPR